MINHYLNMPSEVGREKTKQNTPVGQKLKLSEIWPNAMQNAE